MKNSMHCVKSSLRNVLNSELASVLSKVENLVKSGYRVISLAVGEPDPNAIPVQSIAEILYEIVVENPSSLLYTSTEGIYELRREIANFVYRYDGYTVDPDNLVVTSGATLAIDLFLRLFIDSGDIVVVENPTYINTLYSLKIRGARVVGVPIDCRGIMTEVLEETVKRFVQDGKRVKAIYTMPTGQNPSGISMEIDRRRHLLEIASRYDVTVIEDTAYNYLVLEGDPLPSLKSMDREGRVIAIGTLSKIMGTGFRIGWITLEEPLRSIAINVKQTIDFCAPTISQYLALEFLRKGFADLSIQRSRTVYRMKRDKLIEFLNEYLAEAEYVKPIAGMFMLLKLRGVDGVRFAEDLVEKHHVAVIPGKPFYVDGGGADTMRIAFAKPSIDELKKGVESIAKLYKEYKNNFHRTP